MALVFTGISIWCVMLFLDKELHAELKKRTNLWYLIVIVLLANTNIIVYLAYY